MLFNCIGNHSLFRRTLREHQKPTLVHRSPTALPRSWCNALKHTIRSCPGQTSPSPHPRSWRTSARRVNSQQIAGSLVLACRRSSDRSTSCRNGSPPGGHAAGHTESEAGCTPPAWCTCDAPKAAPPPSAPHFVFSKMAWATSSYV